MIDIVTTLAGLNFRPASAKEAVDNMSMGDTVTLERDPTNEYDSNAVKVIYEGEFIGFIPKVDNFEIASHLDAGKPYRASVAGFAGTRKPTLRIDLFESEDEANAG